MKSLYDSDKLLAVSANAHYYYRDNAQSICHQAATSVNRLFFDELYNMAEISEDLNKWNSMMSGRIVPILEGKIIHAYDQILKYPVLREKRPQDCLFVDRILGEAVRKLN